MQTTTQPQSPKRNPFHPLRKVYWAAAPAALAAALLSPAPAQAAISDGWHKVDAVMASYLAEGETAAPVYADIRTWERCHWRYLSKREGYEATLLVCPAEPTKHLPAYVETWRP